MGGTIIIWESPCRGPLEYQNTDKGTLVTCYKPPHIVRALEAAKAAGIPGTPDHLRPFIDWFLAKERGQGPQFYGQQMKQPSPSNHTVFGTNSLL